MKNYFMKDDEFIIKDYDRQKTFSSFLPAIAGKRGIPLWAFYVNRGQGIASFGVENKDHQILEFNPAVKAYERVGIDGFRTFVKQNGEVSEIFSGGQDNERLMHIRRHAFTIEENNKALGLSFRVTYFGLSNADIPALVRMVEVENKKNRKQSFEILDGVSQLLPTGIGYQDMKSLTNLVRSWMDVKHLDKDMGFYYMRSSSADVAEVVDFEDGHFYLSAVNGELTRPIVDERKVFGTDTTKRHPEYFAHHKVSDVLSEEQVAVNKIPVGFTGVELSLEPGETATIDTVIGHTHSEEWLIEHRHRLVDHEFLIEKHKQSKHVVDVLLTSVETKTAISAFDDYMKQNQLDNILRGGYPMLLPSNGHDYVYHLFSRRHGDLERDYNYFSIAPEFYSQGNGSFRDVCQNRRNDGLLFPDVKEANMKMFGSLIQTDGFNPLSIDGLSFTIQDEDTIERLNDKLFDGHDRMKDVLKDKFTPGSIINAMQRYDVSTDYADAEIFAAIFPHASQHFEAHFAEGYWIDHWTYILDLVETFEAIYPDHLSDALYDDHGYTYFDSPIFVLPRDEKICRTGDGRIRRYGSLLNVDGEKMEKTNLDPNQAGWLMDRSGKIIKATLFEKLFVLSVNKMASLDPSGIGIDMEADKPGWNDAMNGLPAMFGSGVSETIELKRLVSYLIHHFDQTQTFRFPSEFVRFASELSVLLDEKLTDYDYWDAANTSKENYRSAIRFSTKKLIDVSAADVHTLLTRMLEKLDRALDKALSLGNGIYPTYLVHEVTDHKPIKTKGKPKIGHYGLPVVKPLAFEARALPHYLEAPARALKTIEDDDLKRAMFEKIKASDIYDKELEFYKTSGCLDEESNEIGRGKSFTKGWQERESNFLHMTYKYLLGLLKGGLHETFFEEIRTNWTIFMDPSIYGRSVLENSSFIASSINPDPYVRGQGFVARLSGSTAEMLSMWSYMMFGDKPFVYEEEELHLCLHPILSKDFFKDGVVKTTFLGEIEVNYHNPETLDTYDSSCVISRYEVDGESHETLDGEIAERIRDRDVSTIDVFLKKEVQ